MKGGNIKMENKEKAAASRLIKKYSIILILIALMIVLTMIKPQFIKPGNLVNMLRQISLVGILTMGMMLVILIGDIDISGGPQIALTSVICALPAGNVRWFWPS
jgi:ribose/xylose/arabinose/galactoside ABC-type transport system permease subunit